MNRLALRYTNGEIGYEILIKRVVTREVAEWAMVRSDRYHQTVSLSRKALLQIIREQVDDHLPRFAPLYEELEPYFPNVENRTLEQAIEMAQAVVKRFLPKLYQERN